MEPAALPAARMISRPCAARGGRCGSKQLAGCAAAIAVSNKLSRNSRGEFAALLILATCIGAGRPLQCYLCGAAPMAGTPRRHYPVFRSLATRTSPGREGFLIMKLDDTTRTSLEAAVFRRLVEHLRSRTEVQNIDLMNLAGFCRNCLSNWMKEAADTKGVPMTKDESRELVYGMPYEEWKAKYQREASPQQRAEFDAAGHKH